MKTSVLLADAQTLFRDGLSCLLNAKPDISVVGEASEHEEAFALAKRLKPHVIVVDSALPSLGGLETIRRIVQFRRNAKCMALAAVGDTATPSAFLAAGASAYLSKNCTGIEFVSAIRRLRLGGIYLGSADHHGPAAEPLPEDRPNNGTHKLTLRERSVLKLVAEGYTVKEIAAANHLSTATIYTYRHRAMKKLGLRNAADLTRFVLQNGLASNATPSLARCLP